jgi:hypothetical protein
MKERIEEISKDIKQLQYALNGTDLLDAVQEENLSVLHERLNNLAKAIKLLSDVITEQRQLLYNKIRQAENNAAHHFYAESFAMGAVHFGALFGISMNFDLPLKQTYALRFRFGGGLDTTAAPGGLMNFSIDKTYDTPVGALKVGGGLLLAIKIKRPTSYLNASSKWLFGAGPNAYLNVWKGLNLWLQPFIGITQEPNAETIVYPPEYKKTVCGWVVVKDWKVQHLRDPEGSIKLTGGALGGLSWQFF